MSAGRFDEILRPLSPGQRARMAVNAERQNALATLAKETSRGVYLRGGPGVMISSGPQGATVKIRKQRPVPRPVRQFICPATASTETGDITPTAGTVNGNLVTGTAAVTGTGTELVYIDVTCTLTVSANGYVADEFLTETAWTYGVDTALPANTTTHAYVPVATYIAGVRVFQTLTTNINLRPRSTGVGGGAYSSFYWRA